MSKIINDCKAIAQKYVDIEHGVQEHIEFGSKDMIYSLGRRHMAEEILLMLKQYEEGISDERD